MFVNHIINVNKLWLSLFLGLACVMGDNFVFFARGTKLAEALADNATHGLVGALSALIIVLEFSDRLTLTEQKMLIGVGFLVASGIDVDHFIAARSMRLKVYKIYFQIFFKGSCINVYLLKQDATNLSSRPFLHCSNIPFVILLVFLCCITFKSFRLNLWIIVILTAFVTHHIRDATRRGLWIQPYGHTPPIPYAVYIVLTMATPLVAIWLMNAFREKFSVVFDNYRRVLEV